MFPEGSSYTAAIALQGTSLEIRALLLYWVLKY